MPNTLLANNAKPINMQKKKIKKDKKTGAALDTVNKTVKINFDIKRINRLIIVEQSGKSVKNIYWVKKDLFGCFRIEETVKNSMKQV